MGIDVNGHYSLQEKGVCYICGKRSHFLRECSEKKKEGDQLKNGKARVFALRGEKEDQNTNVIIGMLPVFDIPIVVLMDSSSTHSFIFTIFMDKIGNGCVKMSNILEVSLPSSEVINTNRMVKGIKLDIEGKVLKTDLYILGMKDFDVILGINWLGRNYATILCHKNEVLFQKPRKEKFRFFGTRIGTLPRLVSTMKAEKMLRKNTCQGFLLNINSKP
ncbi:uncharacterized protein LOC111374141 [Olea europaea var. sylvestris]|uniref:uncharacterized protein LOC111374141 n=1 Tax=Olea europaea var. sylvestris TaxID=158386 RepID=UPI000C1D8D0D|nr:uncharacterized protein LOC111374141 [Olea europaea var. sylvestris]